MVVIVVMSCFIVARGDGDCDSQLCGLFQCRREMPGDCDGLQRSVFDKRSEEWRVVRWNWC